MNWGEWKRGEIVPRTYTQAQLEGLAKKFGYTVEEVTESLRRIQDETNESECWVNGAYQVFKRRCGAVIHLSIRRLDRAPCRDWRDFQRIKNELVGPEHEGVELYPAESRLVDTANQFHLWVLAKEGERIEVGFNDGRVVSDDVSFAPGAKQRAL